MSEPGFYKILPIVQMMIFALRIVA